jgi:hypothetical protein
VSKRIEKLLQKALLQEGPMAYALYEHELVEHLDYWYNGLVTDQNEFVFAVTENSGDTAMVLITKERNVYVNEMARTKLAQMWGPAYKPNMKRFIPVMAKELANDIIAVNGVTIVE